MSAIGGFTYIQWFSQGPQRSNRAFSESRKSQFRRKSTSEKQTVLSSDGEFSLMSFNVQEFFEPCMDVVRSWEKSSKTDTSIHAFAKTHPGVLDQQFVAENARRRMSWSACKNMSDSQWDAGVALVRSVIVESDADVIALQEFAVTRIDIVPAGFSEERPPIRQCCACAQLMGSAFNRGLRSGTWRSSAAVSCLRYRGSASTNLFPGQGLLCALERREVC